MAELLGTSREWLTSAETATHLSKALSREVTEADVLRLGLDGDLTLSVNFVNFARGRLGKVTPRKEATVRTITLPEGHGSFQEIGHRRVSETEVLQLDAEVVVVDGLWDLSMLGNERDDVEHRFQKLTGGPDVEAFSDGVFLHRPDGTWCQLYEYDNVTRMRLLYCGYYAGELRPLGPPVVKPSADAVLVVRTAELDDLVRRTLTPSDKEPPTPTVVRSEQTERTSGLRYGRRSQVGNVA